MHRLTCRLRLLTVAVITSLFLYSTPEAGPVTDGINKLLQQLPDKIDSDILEPDQAFIISAQAIAPNSVNVHWEIAQGYYLYKDKFDFSFPDDAINITSTKLPKGKYKTDPDFGGVWIYYDSVDAQLILETDKQNLPASEAKLLVKYQGCKEDTLCYPPISKTLSINFNGYESSQQRPTNIESVKAQQSVQDTLTERLVSGNLLHNILTFFVFGLLLSLTPCVFPMVPILSGIIVNQGHRLTTLHAFYMSLTYVVAMAATYAVLGVIAGSFALNLQVAAQNDWVIIIFSTLFILLALSMFGFYEIQLPTNWSNILAEKSSKQSGSLKGVATMGVLSALIVGPCVAPPLAAALLYISQTGDTVLGGATLFALGLGMGIPLLVIGTSAGKLLPQAGAWMTHIKHIFGVLMLGTALWFMDRILPAPLVLMLGAFLLIIPAVYMGALDSSAGVSKWQKLWRGLGLVMLIYGILLIIGATSGSNQILKPLAGLFGNYQTTHANSNTLSFQTIKGIEGLQAKLEQAKRNSKPVMLDFYADWCITCKEMEQGAFADREVQKMLRDNILLQADVTQNDALDQALLKKFAIYGPPAILFFDATGLEQKSRRIVGFMNSNNFLKHIQQTLNP